MGYIDPLGRFIRDPDVDFIDNLSSSNRTKPFQFLTQFVRNEHDEIVNFILISNSSFILSLGN